METFFECLFFISTLLHTYNPKYFFFFWFVCLFLALQQIFFDDDIQLICVGGSSGTTSGPYVDTMDSTMDTTGDSDSDSDSNSDSDGSSSSGGVRLGYDTKTIFLVSVWIFAICCQYFA